MIIKNLVIRDFRNIPKMELSLSQDVNIIYGDNGQGKTNLMEAIYLLTGQRSFRQNKENDLVRFGQSQAEITAGFFAGGRDQEVRLTIEGGKRSALLNELPAQLGELTGRFLAVVFSPTELALVRDGPNLRRAFLDSAITQVMPRYQKTLAAFSRALLQRNSLLSDISRRLAPEDGLLDVWDQSLARLSYSIINARCRYLRRLAPLGEEIYRDISRGKEVFSMSYLPSIPGEWGDLKEREGEELILGALQKNRPEDLKNGYTGIGPHRDDVGLLVNGVSARFFGSQGQQRSCVLTLKLAECRVIRDIAGEQPVILLDDVLSELDKARRDFLLAGLAPGQLFITCCDRTGLSAIPSGVTWRIQSGTLAARRRVPKRKKEG